MDSNPRRAIARKGKFGRFKTFRRKVHPSLSANLLSPPAHVNMKFNYDVNYITKITKLSKEFILELLKYFDGLPLQAKLEAFYISKIIEEDDEFAFHQHYFDKDKSAEYEFSLFILGVERIYSVEHRESEIKDKKLSSYKLNLISKIKELRKQDV